MNSPDKNQTIAVLVAGSKDCVTQTEAEELQYNLLGRGFRWDNGAPKGYRYIDLRNFTDWVLLVNIKTKTLKWSPNQLPFVSSDNAYSVIQLWSSGLSNAIRHIVNPPPAPPDYVEVKGKVRVYDDDTVEFYEAGDHLLTTDKATIKDVARELGLLNTSKVNVVVQFDYPSSCDSRSQSTRRVQVLSMDLDFLTGIEISRGNEKTGTFKKYRLTRLLSNIKLYSFDTE